jgi:hypothetical protein
MTSEAAAAVIGYFLFRLRQSMRIMTGNAAELPLAVPKTAAAVNLLGMAARFLAVGKLFRANEHRQKKVQGQPGPIIEPLAPAPQDPDFALEVALLANGITQSRSKRAGVDNRPVCFLTALDGLNVQFAGPMAAFAADRVATEDRQPI